MLKPLNDEWTIVMAGKWNVSIFSPKWLKEHILKDPELSIEVGLEPGTPRRLEGDRVLIVPTPNRLIIQPRQLDEQLFTRAEEIACTLLEKLPHTPLTAVGLNFGFEANLDEMPESLPDFLGTKLSAEGINALSRGFTWALQREPYTLNLSSEIREDSTVFKFNYHSNTPSSEEARNRILGKYRELRLQTFHLLKVLFNVEDSK